jgi:YaiO family outer membrane protein
MLKEYKPAYRTAQLLLAIQPSGKYRDYAEYLKSKTYSNQVGVSHLQSFFSTASFASVTGIQYMHQFSKASVTTYLNFGQRTQGAGVQACVDAYFTHNAKYYSNAFLNVSPGTAFPYWQAGYSLFRNFSKGWEGEAGTRYLGFDSVNNYTAVLSVGKYIKNAWLNLRGFYTSNTKSWYQSYLLTARQYLNDNKDYFTVFLGLSTVPDDQSQGYNFNTFSQFISRSVGLGFRKTFHYNTILNIVLNHIDQQITPQQTIHQFDAYITLLRNF